jgi:NADPH2:quinone reductase
MRSWLVSSYQKAGLLFSQSAPVPRLSLPDQVLIRVRAAGLNFADVLQIQGLYQDKPALPFVPGVEFSGVVEEAGASAASQFSRGERVFGMGQGAFGELLVARASDLRRTPAGMSDEEAAGFGVTFPTALHALNKCKPLGAGSTVLVHAAAGGTGSAAVQIAKAMGIRVIATSGGPEKQAVATRLGADLSLDSSGDWAAQVKAACPQGVDAVFDPVGGQAAVDSSLRLLRFGGTYLVIGFASGGGIPSVALNKLLLKEIVVRGVYYGGAVTRDPAEGERLFQQLFALHAQGKLKPLVGKVIPIENLEQGLADLSTRKSTGKIIVSHGGKQAKL